VSRFSAPIIWCAAEGLASASFWSGLIDDVRIYDRAVTP
jgi:hypothetical protein